jgi:hypothetical protein
MNTDSLDPAGIYFGTRSGELFGSTDEGKSWKMILSGLPAIVCVKAAVVGEARAPRNGKPATGASGRSGAARKKSLTPRMNKKRGKR